MSGNVSEFGFGSGDSLVSTSRFEKFKAKQGESYRMSFVWWPLKDGKPDLDAASPRFVGARRFFIQNVGYVLDKGPEIAKFANGPSKATVATIVCIWPTDKRGGLDKDRFLRGDFDVKPWVFSGQTYEQLARRHNEFPFGQCDLTVLCTDTQFQKLDITPCRDSLFRKTLENPQLATVHASVMDAVNAIAADIQGLLGRDLTPEQIREKIGGAPASPVGSVTSSEVDSVLDDLLG